ncbi:hypothetical protein SARC_09480 [Sphaeroforma arctica JP610]|uniref:Uncharacterized protein n=1 Tax=Sphaeroforma arctica JP610 TaxID=667725 RepID=A0A0L0FMV4_9EUKA|nr:hypothetical protein SARC_09480 [Sphaeroforma arctica JP610]KNC78072.1 hypothetical protein SARC_09480 [Sphaeroforma arctica JP610]|eukprot:XP_014151974.1 hypothetical protein SARC_09480 [Sphaeroforma arctica JP610]
MVGFWQPQQMVMSPEMKAQIEEYYAEFSSYGLFTTASDKLAGFLVISMLLLTLLTPKVFNLEHQFTFYASYHNNFFNKLIHFLCIWPIFWTSLVFFAHTSPIHNLPDILQSMLDMIPAQYNQYMVPDWSAIVADFYCIYYLVLDPAGGMVAAALVGFCYTTAQMFTQGYWETVIRPEIPIDFVQGLSAGQAALVLHVTAWLFQFWGHGIHEGRAPALTKNPAQAFLMAPYFVLLEVLSIFGYQAELHERVHKKVIANIAQFDADAAAKKNKKSN